MTPDGGITPMRPVPSTGAERPLGGSWWKWWPLAAVGASVWAWFASGVDVAYAMVVAGVAIHALVSALERGRSTVRAAVEATTWSAGAWLAGVALGAATGWGSAARVTLGALGLVAGAAVVALVLIVRGMLGRSR